jgi:hypothetical protein
MKITAEQFLELVQHRPSAFEHWNTPLEITGVVNCIESRITHLSPFLTFSGRNNVGETAKFNRCYNLKTATGTFKGWVSFANCGIKKIENLHIKNPDRTGAAASFYGCKSLQIATGTYPGFVNFSESGIHSIQNLEIQTPKLDNIYAAFQFCENLKNLKNWNLSKPIEIEPIKFTAEKERRALQKFVQKTQPEELPFLCKKSPQTNFLQ